MINSFLPKIIEPNSYTTTFSLLEIHVYIHIPIHKLSPLETATDTGTQRGV